MAGQLKRWLLVAGLVLTAARAHAAAPSDSTREILAGVVRAMEASLSAVPADSVPAALRERFLVALDRTRVMAGDRPGLLELARSRRSRPAVFGADLSDPDSPAAAVRTLLDIQSAVMFPIMSATLPADSLRRLEGLIDRYRHTDLMAAHEQLLERLHHYEIKYGPGSPRLNGLETLVNFFTQRIPPFKPGRNGVSRFEVVSGYSTSYATMVEGEASAMSAAEFGVRIYNWGYTDDPMTVARSALPRYWTLALAVGPEKDGALRWPWDGKPRIGPLVSWGELKLAYLISEHDDWRVIVSRQFQLLPHIF